MSMRGPVPNQFPSREGSLRIALVGESPGQDELRTGIPFSGAAGFTLNRVLAVAGIAREECFVGNVSQHRPGASSNEFSLLAWEGSDVQQGIDCLLRDLAAFKPNIVVALGNVPLHLFKRGNEAPPKTPKGVFAWPTRITAWRGSLFTTHPSLGLPTSATVDEALREPWFRPWKCLATWHPAYVNRVYACCFEFRQDLRRAREEGATPTLTLPEVEITVGPTPTLP